jgi:hypothetical protein
MESIEGEPADLYGDQAAHFAGLRRELKFEAEATLTRHYGAGGQGWG